MLYMALKSLPHEAQSAAVSQAEDLMEVQSHETGFEPPDQMEVQSLCPYDTAYVHVYTYAGQETIDYFTISLNCDITLQSRTMSHLIALLGGGARHLTRLCFGFYGYAVGMHAQHIMHQWFVGPYMLKHLQPGTAKTCQAANGVKSSSKHSSY